MSFWRSDKEDSMITKPPTLDQYLALITSEHSDKPKFMATITADIQPLVDLMATLFDMLGMFNPDAEGDQLDKFATWVGANRNLAVALPNVYFTWGDAALGWGNGTWLGPGDNPAGLTVLPDDSFQVLVKLVIAMNSWDGTIPGAYTAWNTVMGTQYGILIQDNQDETMLIVFTGLVESIITKALITGGFFNLVPAGVRVTQFAKPSIAATPVFGWGPVTAQVKGWGTGCWIEPLL
jgi:hypothetical protein